MLDENVLAKLIASYRPMQPFLARSVWGRLPFKPVAWILLSVWVARRLRVVR
jgi:hypothetical protein